MLKVAFATADGVHVNQHFGWCWRFDIYQISTEGFSLVESRRLAPAGEDEDDKIQSRLDAVRDCAMVCMASIGGTAAARMVNARIHPVKVKEAEEIAAVLERLREVLAGTPPPWLRKLLLGSRTERVGFAER